MFFEFVFPCRVYLIFCHPFSNVQLLGSTAGKCTREECIRTVAATLNYVLERTEYLTIC